MPRYIDADELKEYINAFIRVDEHYHPKGKHDLIPISEVYDRIEQTPTADVVERKKGKWIGDAKYGWIPSISMWWQTTYECSICGEKGIKDWQFCPHCGADMRGEEDDNERKDISGD